ncbi:MAG: helix-turn-helix transcriptional regulator [Halolamina sp.]
MRHAAPVVTLLVAVALLAGPVGAVTVAVGGPSPDDAAASPSVSGPTDGSATAATTTAVTGPDVAGTTFEIQLRADGDARWVVTTRYRLANETEREAFRDYGERFVAGGVETPVGVDAETFRTAADGASTVAGRPMNVTGVSRGYDFENRSVGGLRLTFTWTNFLGTEGEELVLRDALLTATPSGGTDTWLDRLGPRQTLVVRTPPGYSLRSQPGVPYRNNSLVVEGPHEFDPEEPFVVSYDQVSDPDTGTDTEGTPSIGGDLPLAAVGGVLVAAVVLIGVFAFRRSSRIDDGGPTAADAGPGDDGAGASGAESTGDGSESAAVDGESGPVEPGAEPEPEPEPELLSDGERVERLLAANDGRMRQTDIVDETGWSDAKVSQLLSEMAEEDRVEKLRIGRENLISLADDDEADGE